MQWTRCCFGCASHFLIQHASAAEVSIGSTCCPSTVTSVPFHFHALPTKGFAMYAPEVKAISDEMRLRIKE